MTTSSKKRCVSCGQTREMSEFEKDRTTCVGCRQKAYQKRTSSTYQSFLRNLYTKSRSAVVTKNRTKDHVWEITADDLIDLWEKQGGRCALSGVYLTHHIDGSGHKEYNASLDRISQDIGYTTTNIQLVCYRVNILKHTLPEDMLFWWIKTIHDFSCD